MGALRNPAIWGIENDPYSIHDIGVSPEAKFLKQSNFVRDVFSLYTHAFSFFDKYQNYKSQGWDGYSADAVSKTTINNAKKVVSYIPGNQLPNHHGPGIDGSICLDFELKQPFAREIIEVYLDINPNNTVTLTRKSNSKKTYQKSFEISDQNLKLEITQVFRFKL